MMLRTGMLLSLLACYSAVCLAEASPAKLLQDTSMTVESATSNSQNSSSNTARAQVISVRASCEMPPTASPIKVIDMYWTRGLENERVVGGKADHYVELNLVVRTADFTPGECVEASIRTEDNSEIAENIEKIVLRGNVNGEGVVYFYAPLKDYTLNLSGNE